MHPDYIQRLGLNVSPHAFLLFCISRSGCGLHDDSSFTIFSVSTYASGSPCWMPSLLPGLGCRGSLRHAHHGSSVHASCGSAKKRHHWRHGKSQMQYPWGSLHRRLSAEYAPLLVERWVLPFSLFSYYLLFITFPESVVESNLHLCPSRVCSWVQSLFPPESRVLHSVLWQIFAGAAI